jgi:hypothetical protein
MQQPGFGLATARRIISMLRHGVKKGTTLSIRDQWKTGVQNEVDFWRAVFEGKQFPAFTQDMMDRACPEKELEKYILPYLPKDVPIAQLKILDVAAGPISGSIAIGVEGGCLKSWRPARLPDGNALHASFGSDAAVAGRVV